MDHDKQARKQDEAVSNTITTPLKAAGNYATKKLTEIGQRIAKEITKALIKLAKKIIIWLGKLLVKLVSLAVSAFGWPVVIILAIVFIVALVYVVIIAPNTIASELEALSRDGEYDGKIMRIYVEARDRPEWNEDADAAAREAYLSFEGYCYLNRGFSRFQKWQARNFSLPHEMTMGIERMEMFAWDEGLFQSREQDFWEPNPEHVHEHLRTYYQWMDSEVHYEVTVDYEYTYSYTTEGGSERSGSGSGTEHFSYEFDVKLLIEADAYDYLYELEYGDYVTEHMDHSNLGVAYEYNLPGTGNRFAGSGPGAGQRHPTNPAFGGSLHGTFPSGSPLNDPPPASLDSEMRLNGQTFYVEISAYAPLDPRSSAGMCYDPRYGRDALAAPGVKAWIGDGSKENPYCIAACNNILPIGTLIYIEGVGYGLVMDTGGLMRQRAREGKILIDILVYCLDEANTWGRRHGIPMTVLDTDLDITITGGLGGFGTSEMSQNLFSCDLQEAISEDMREVMQRIRERVIPEGATNVNFSFTWTIVDGSKTYQPLTNVYATGDQFERTYDYMDWHKLGHRPTDLDMQMITQIATNYSPWFRYSNSPFMDMGFGTAGEGMLIPWSEVHPMFPVGMVVRVQDVATGIEWNAVRWGGREWAHADVEPVTASDSAALLSAYGSWSWNRRGIVVTIPRDGGEIYVAASMNGMPHGRGGIRNNNFAGHHCFHFYRSKGHGSGSYDGAHHIQMSKAAGDSARVAWYSNNRFTSIEQVPDAIPPMGNASSPYSGGGM